MKTHLILILLLIVVVPLLALGWMGSRMLDAERGMVQYQFKKTLAQRLRDVDVGVSKDLEDLRIRLKNDLDFSDLRQFKPDTHYGLLLVRLPNPSRQSLIEHVESAFKKEAIETWQRCFVVLTDRKIRIRRS